MKKETSDDKRWEGSMEKLNRIIQQMRDDHEKFWKERLANK